MWRLKIKQILRANRGILIFFFSMVVFRTAVADWNYVPSGSMEPTMYDGDYLWVNKLSFGPSIPFTEIKLFSTGSPERGDIITFYRDGSDVQLVKRVIGVPGDHIFIQGNQFQVNGETLLFHAGEERNGMIKGEELIDGTAHKVQLAKRSRMAGQSLNVMVPEGRYFVMGDNRDNSFDSRFWGFVAEDKIMGKVTHIAFSLSKQRPFLDRFAIKI